MIKHIVSLSGGIGSYATLERVLQHADPAQVEAVFCDTMAEDGDLYRFLEDIEHRFGLQIVRLCRGKTPMELAFETKFLFNSRFANCSRELKSKPFQEYISQYDPEECIIYLGIDWTESHRKDAIIRHYAPYHVEFPMCDKPYLSKEDMLNDLRSAGITIPRMYQLGFSHNNCGGCCFKAGIGHYKLLLEKDRNRYLEFENKEEALRRTLGKDVAILKRKGKPFTLRQLRTMIDTAPEQLSLFDCYDIGGCGCFYEDDNDETAGGGH